MVLLHGRAGRSTAKNGGVPARAVNNTIVKKAAAEYSGAAGINVGYTIGTTLTHNDVHDLSYVGISVGWGWGTPDIAGWATIAWNKVHNYKQLLNDGGGIYMLGSQVGSAARDRASPTIWGRAAWGHR